LINIGNPYHNLNVSVKTENKLEHFTSSKASIEICSFLKPRDNERQ